MTRKKGGFIFAKDRHVSDLRQAVLRPLISQWQSVLLSSYYNPNFHFGFHDLENRPRFSSYPSPRLSFCLRHMAEELDYESLPPNAGLAVSILSYSSQTIFVKPC